MTEINTQIILITLLIFVGIYIYFTSNNKYQDVMNKAYTGFTIEDKKILLDRINNMKKQKIININKFDNDYMDPISKDDHMVVDDPLKYPYVRLPRNLINMYKDNNNGHFNNMNNYYDDTEKLVGNLIIDATSSITGVPAILLFEKPSAINKDKYFYYIIDTRVQDFKIKVPLKNIKINGRIRNNVLDYGIEQIYDDDIIEILDYNFADGTVFRAKLFPRQSGLYYNPTIPTINPTTLTYTTY